MEGRALNGPPPGLENVVLFLIPPAARESVAGDLWELYRGPSQYVCDALGAIVFIVASQARRNLDFPVLAVKGILLFTLMLGFSSRQEAAALTASILALMVLGGAYQSGGRPSPRLAMIEAVLAAGGAAELAGLVAAHAVKPGLSEMPYFTFLGPYMVPLLCLVRTALVRWGDRGNRGIRRELSVDEVRSDYRLFERRVARRNLVEILALVSASIILARMPFATPAYLMAALYLLVDGAVRPAPMRASFSGLRCMFQEQMARQHRIRCLVWWLWFVPPVLTLQKNFGGTRPLFLLSGMAAALLVGFFIESLNRERRGRILEEIGDLTLAIERSGP